MARKRYYTDEQFINAVKNSYSIAQVLKVIGLSYSGSNYCEVKKRIKKLEIDNSHFNGQGWSNGSNHERNKKFSLNQILVENSSYNRWNLKKRLIKEGLLINKCVICGQLPLHNNKQLVMVIDHINGVNNDNRLENLRLLCPNCNSQQPTFAGRNVRKIKKIRLCKSCNKKISSHSKSGLCSPCFNKNREY